MTDILWDFSISLEDERAVEKFELKYATNIPKELKEIIKKHNAGMPNLNTFDTEETKGRTIKSLLSFNKNDEENIYEFLNLFMEDSQLKMIPFALDNFGNFICIKGSKIIMWISEEEETELVADTFSDFLNILK